MITLFYLILFLLSLFLTGSFLYRHKRVDTSFVLFGILVNLNSLGRFLISGSENLEIALLGTYSTIIMFFVFTIGKTEHYYKKWHWDKEMGSVIS